jgi:hypothetical protein
LAPRCWLAPKPHLTADARNLYMNRMSFRGHRGFSYDFREARVGMHGHTDLLWGALDELGEDALGDENPLDSPSISALPIALKGNFVSLTS